MKNSWRHVLLKLEDGVPRSIQGLPNGHGHCMPHTGKYASGFTMSDLRLHRLVSRDWGGYTITDAGRQALAEWRQSKKEAQS